MTVRKRAIVVLALNSLLNLLLFLRRGWWNDSAWFLDYNLYLSCLSAVIICYLVFLCRVTSRLEDRDSQRNG